jgi:hypothetical protein
MTELNIAYSYNSDLSDTDNSEQFESLSNTQQPQQLQQLQQPPQQSSPPQMSQQVQQSQQVQYQAPVYQPSVPQPTYYSQPAPPKKVVQRAPEYSFWDRMAMSRNDVLKLFILSLIIVLGISLERLGSHYIKQYLTDNVLSPLQEFIVRLSYPVIIFLFLWIIKSL